MPSRCEWFIRNGEVTRASEKMVMGYLDLDFRETGVAKGSKGRFVIKSQLSKYLVSK